MAKKKKAHFLYLIEKNGASSLELLTEADAARMALIEDVSVWNTHKALDMEPDYLEVDDD
jgi:hypothetical protein